MLRCQRFETDYPSIISEELRPFLPRLQKRFTISFTRVELIVVTAIVLTVFLTFSDLVGNAKYIGRVASCKANLRQIGLATQTYRDNHKGAMPAHLQLLLLISKSRGVFWCSLSGYYEYRFLEKPKNTDIICWDVKPHHPQHAVFVFLNRDNRNVLFADGEVANMEERQFQSLHLRGQTWILER